MSSMNRLSSSRHPKVVLIFQHEEDITCLAPLIMDVNPEYRAVLANQHLADEIKQLAPSVVLFALDSVLISAQVYLNLVEQSALSKAHYSILLCNNKESGLAFQSCIKKLFDNYFVFQPLYEKFRLKLIIHQGLSKCEQSYQFNEQQSQLLSQQNEEFTALLEQGVQWRQSLVGTIEQSKKNLPEPVANADDQEQMIKNQILHELNEKHLAPMFHLLESNIVETLNGMLSNISKQQQQLQSTENNTEYEDKATLLQNKDITHLVSQMEQLIKEPEPEQKRKLLIVEDNHIYREMISGVLQKEGFEIDEAEDGLKAIKKIKSTKYSLIIMDLFMPHLDGLNTTRHIRKLRNGKKTPIIALSGNKRKELVQKWASHGLSGYIMKPSTKSEILTAVSKALN